MTLSTAIAMYLLFVSKGSPVPSHGLPGSSLSSMDLARASLPRPLPTSHVIGGSPTAIFDAMNRHLRRQPHHTKPCESYSFEELNRLARSLWTARNAELAAMYKGRGDKRDFHFDDSSLDYKETLWRAEDDLVANAPADHGDGTEWYSMVRDGKCSEMVMWWVHHIDTATKTTLAAAPNFTIPLMPANGGTVSAAKASLGTFGSEPLQSSRIRRVTESHTREYLRQVSCTDCHWDANNHSDVADLTHGTDPTPAGTCPPHPLTGKPTVWYEPMSDVGNRRKRCDWDYDPPCGLCEGVGGYAWGDGEHQIAYTECTPVAQPHEIPAHNLTAPEWPISFVVYQPFITMINQLNYGGQFPGPDPCTKHVYRNDTELLHYDDSRVNYTGPIIYMITRQTHFYQMPSADVFIKIDNAFCICVSPDELGGGIGPLVHDFAKDAVLIGREMIGLEGLNTSVEADHWTKGPHHFWIAVATNRYVRGWQPWNGLNVYEPGSWKIGPVPEEVFVPPESCRSGLLHRNISCKAPYSPPR